MNHHCLIVFLIAGCLILLDLCREGITKETFRLRAVCLFLSALLMCAAIVVYDWVRFRSTTIAASDAASFGEHCLPSFQKRVGEFSQFASDVHAFIHFRDNNPHGIQTLFVCGKLKQPPVASTRVQGCWEIGDYFADPNQGQPNDRPWLNFLVSRAISSLGEGERAFWQERWQQRGADYRLSIVKPSMQSSMQYLWYDAKTNFVIAAFFSEGAIDAYIAGLQ